MSLLISSFFLGFAIGWITNSLVEHMWLRKRLKELDEELRPKDL